MTAMMSWIIAVARLIFVSGATLWPLFFLLYTFELNISKNIFEEEKKHKI